jgi:phospholipase/carboxylesterase
MNPADEPLPCVTIEPAGAANAAVIWLHGLGADGHDFEPIVARLGLPRSLAIRFRFPHAPHRPVTINNGMVMRAWYDIAGPEQRWREDEAGIRKSEGLLRCLIERETGLGVRPEYIVLAGFSQGGAIALQTGLRYPATLSGIAALSTYLPLATRLADEADAANRHTPILMAHGRQDTIIPLELARRSRDLLLGAGHPVDWREYDIAHSVCAEEIDAISAWLAQVLTRSPGPS